MNESRIGCLILSAMMAASLWGCNNSHKADPDVVTGGNSGAYPVGDPIRVAGATEVDLVEEMARYRANYRSYLETLKNFYIQKGYSQKAKWAERELADLNMVKTYAYIVPAETRQANEAGATDSIPAADALYEDGMNYARQGGYHGVPLVYDKDDLKKALERMNRLIRDYPTSDKVDDAAFVCAEIYKEYFNDNERAVIYYQRTWEWDPYTPHPARFQAAVVYDYRLHDRDRALELYREVVDKENTNRSNLRWSVRRIQQLTGGRELANYDETAPPPQAPAQPRPPQSQSPLE